MFIQTLLDRNCFSRRIDFSECIDYNFFEINKHLASPPGGDKKEVQDFTVGTAHGAVRYKAKS